MIYTPKYGRFVVNVLKNLGFNTARLIGSLSRGKNSKHDIDILLKGLKRSYVLRKKLGRLLHSESFEYTDWGGIYFKNTIFGDVDIFFSTKGFDKNYE